MSTTPTHENEQTAEGHINAELRQVVVRGFVRDDPDWRAAVEETLRVAYSNPDPQVLANAIDAAMMRGIHAAVRTDAVRDLGVVSRDSKNPLRRLAWRVVGSRSAARRARALNRESAAIAARKE